jgi:hypothetical protein
MTETRLRPARASMPLSQSELARLHIGTPDWSPSVSLLDRTDPTPPQLEKWRIYTELAPRLLVLTDSEINTSTLRPNQLNEFGHSLSHDCDPKCNVAASNEVAEAELYYERWGMIDSPVRVGSSVDSLILLRPCVQSLRIHITRQTSTINIKIPPIATGCQAQNQEHLCQESTCLGNAQNLFPFIRVNCL